MYLDGTGDAKSDGDTVIDNGRDQGRRHALVADTDGIGQDNSRSGEGHIHAPWNNQQSDKGQRPVGLVDGGDSAEDIANGKCQHGDEHDPARLHLLHEETRREGGDEAHDSRGHEFGGREKRGALADDYEKAPVVVDPDAKTGPAAGDAGEDEGDIGVQNVEGDEWMRCEFDLVGEERGQDDRADDQEDVDVRLFPAYDRALIPRDVDEDQPRYTQCGTNNVQLESEF